MKSGTTVVVVTHNREIVNAMQKRVITMKKGVIISDEEKVGISMKISTLFYTIKQGFVNIFRNKWYSLASIATIIRMSVSVWTVLLHRGQLSEYPEDCRRRCIRYGIFPQ